MDRKEATAADAAQRTDGLSVTDVKYPDWYKAATLVERLDLPPATPLGTSDDLGPAGGRSGAAELRFARWLSNPVVGGSRARLSERLAIDGASLEDLRRLLGEAAHALRDRHGGPPRWLVQLDQAFDRYFASQSLPWQDEIDELLGEDIGLLEIVRPLMVWGIGRFKSDLSGLASAEQFVPFDPDGLVQMLLPDLVETIAVLTRTMVLELNVSRVQGELIGDTPEERFHSFVDRLRQAEVSAAILREYPVLARQLTEGVNRWVDVSLEFALHLCRDWGVIRSNFSRTADPGTLTEVDLSAGDRHRGGRSVKILIFSSGLRLVYKPRSLAVDAHFQELLAWLNGKMGPQTFREITVVDHHSHGWVEYVDAFGCTSTDQLERFYERQGGYLALLYALAATDFHLENLIASGEYPVLVDLEALFHPNTPKGQLAQVAKLTNDALNGSVMRVGFLPLPMITDQDQVQGFDISGLGGADGQLSPKPLLQLEGTDTDEMRLARKRIELPGGKNRPDLNGIEVDTSEYTENITDGFIKVYRVLEANRDELLANGGLLSRFAQDEVRYIVRPTQTYSTALTESLHPDFLRDGLSRDRFLSCLWSSEEGNSRLAVVFSYEKADLALGDVPIFTTRPDSADLWSASGHRIENFFDVPGLGLARRCIQRMGEEDLERQLWFIRASLTAFTLGEGSHRWPLYDLSEASVPATGEGLIAAAEAVGNRLDFLTLRGDEDVAWLGLSLLNEKNWALLPLGTDMYSGTSGIALFLGYLGAVTGNDRCTSLAEATAETIRRQWRDTRGQFAALSGNSRPPVSIGGFNELSGTVYVLAHLGTLWDRPDYLDEAEDLATETLPWLIDEAEEFDVMSGVAGCLMVLLTLNESRPSTQILQLAVRCGNRLLESALPTEKGIGWPFAESSEPLAGFSHGAAGISLALLKLAGASGEERFGAAARQALAYERSLFDHSRQNWPDLRDSDEQVTSTGEDRVFMTAWCHGAPGIGIGRVQAMEFDEDELLSDEIKVAAKTTLAEGFGLNHSLCHGDIGNLDFLLLCSYALDDDNLRALVYRIAAGVLQSIKKQGWLCGVPLGVETPGLMTGLAGIGYGLLRLAEPSKVPSVLSLSPPPVAWKDEKRARTKFSGTRANVRP